MPEFRIYYDDSSTYDGDPFGAPFFGVLAIVQEDRSHGRRLITNSDYFVWMGKGWLGVDFIGMIDYLSQAGHRKVICGRMVEMEHFHEIAGRADRDTDFPERTGHHLGEERL